MSKEMDCKFSAVSACGHTRFSVGIVCQFDEWKRNRCRCFLQSLSASRKDAGLCASTKNNNDEREAKCIGSLQKTLPSFFCQPRLDVLLCRVAFARKG
jgi:hypothetical protein